MPAGKRGFDCEQYEESTTTTTLIEQSEAHVIVRLLLQKLMSNTKTVSCVSITFSSTFFSSSLGASAATAPPAAAAGAEEPPAPPDGTCTFFFFLELIRTSRRELTHRRKLGGALGNQVIDRLALNLGEELAQERLVGLNANGGEQLGDILSGRGGLATGLEEEVCSNITHLQKLINSESSGLVLAIHAHF